jgi:hypothetical protein
MVYIHFRSINYVIIQCNSTWSISSYLFQNSQLGHGKLQHTLVQKSNIIGKGGRQ